MSTDFHQDTLFRTTYTQGTILLLYGLGWLAAAPGGYWLLEGLFPAGSGLVNNLLLATAAAALMGAAGAATTMLGRLTTDIAVTPTFPQQSKLSYVTEPFIGLAAGLGSLYLIAIPANLLINFASSGQLLFAESFASPLFTAIQLLLAWIAGFYQRQGFTRLQAALKRADEKPSGKKAAIVGSQVILSYKQEIRERQQLLAWSYTWGLFVLGYGIIWSVLLLVTYLAWGTSPFSAELNNFTLFTALILAAWPAAMAGGIGGSISLLTDLYRSVSYRQDFHRQHLMRYLIQPLVGVSFGTAIYLFVASGYLSLKPFVGIDSTTTKVVDAVPVIMAHMVLGWAAGFRQQFIGNLVQGLIYDLVDFVKVVGKVINPVNLFNKDKREKALRELSRKTELFKPLTEESTSSESFKWWAPD